MPATTLDPISIHKIRTDSTLGTTVSSSSALPIALRVILKFWLFPKVLRQTNSLLSNERVGLLTVEEAKSLYPPLRRFHEEVSHVLLTIKEEPWIVRLLLRGWIVRVDAELERLGDILESLAWCVDDELRCKLTSEIAKTELQLR